MITYYPKKLDVPEKDFQEIKAARYFDLRKQGMNGVLTAGQKKEMFDCFKAGMDVIIENGSDITIPDFIESEYTKEANK